VRSSASLKILLSYSNVSPRKAGQKYIVTGWNIYSVVTTVYLAPFLRYSTSNNGVPSKNGRVAFQHVVSVRLQRLTNAVNCFRN